MSVLSYIFVKGVNSTLSLRLMKCFDYRESISVASNYANQPYSQTATNRSLLFSFPRLSLSSCSFVNGGCGRISTKSVRAVSFAAVVLV